MLATHSVCAQAVFDGGADDPRTRVYLYQQRLRAELLEKAAEAERRSWRCPVPVMLHGLIRSIMVLRPVRLAGQASAGRAEPRFLWVCRRSRFRSGPITLQGYVLGAIAGGLVGAGTLHEIAAQLSMGRAAFRVALRALRDGGWVAVQLLPGEQMVLRLERRRASTASALTLDRRLHADAWAL